MFSLGTSEILVILVVALVVFGKRLPDVARSVGKTVAEFRRGLQGLQRDFEQEMTRDERAARSGAAAVRASPATAEAVASAVQTAPGSGGPAADSSPSGQSPVAPETLAGAASAPAPVLAVEPALPAPEPPFGTPPSPGATMP